jgi:hypothetical protein
VFKTGAFQFVKNRISASDRRVHFPDKQIPDRPRIFLFKTIPIGSAGGIPQKRMIQAPLNAFFKPGIKTINSNSKRKLRKPLMGVSLLILS